MLRGAISLNKLLTEVCYHPVLSNSVSQCLSISVSQALSVPIMFSTAGLLFLSLMVPSTVLCGKCEDCLNVVAGLQEAALSPESLTMQQGMILSMICPDAGLGGPDDHPNCEK